MQYIDQEHSRTLEQRTSMVLRDVARDHADYGLAQLEAKVGVPYMPIALFFRMWWRTTCFPTNSAKLPQAAALSDH